MIFYSINNFLKYFAQGFKLLSISYITNRMATFSDQMHVTKRNGSVELVSFDKIQKRVENLCNNIQPKLNINYGQLVMKIIDQIYNGITTAQIDELVAEQCASLSTLKLDYGSLASRVVISNHQKNTDDNFKTVVDKLYNFLDTNGQPSPLVSEDLYTIVSDSHETIEKMIDYSRDFDIDYFGFKTLERAYLMKINKKIVERPQHMWMRVAIGIHGSNLVKVQETYDLMSQKYFTHATPTLFNAGTPRPQLSSCYLIAMEDDSIDGIFNTLKECARISKWAGGIGLHVHNIRATGTHIRGTNGTSNGLVPMLRVFNMTARYVDQGGGKRNGSFAIYLEPWHADINAFLDLKKNHGDEEQRARDLFYGLWIPDKFMEAVKDNKEWHLFCPDICKGLSDAYGDNFNELYDKYVAENKYVKVVKARELWFKILDSQMETGTPYLLYKCAANSKSNQKNLGTIKSSNLCTEIIEYSDKNQTAVCNLASIGLAKFVDFENPFDDGEVKVYSKDKCKYCRMLKTLLNNANIPFEEIKISAEDFDNFKQEHGVSTVPQLYFEDNLIGGYDAVKKIVTPYYDFDKLHYVAKVVTKNLDKVIDVNYYPTPKTQTSNLLHRPIGIGVQGLADTFAQMDIAFDSDTAIKLNKDIFETIYHAALEASNEIAKDRSSSMAFIKGYHKSNNIFSFDTNDLDTRREYGLLRSDQLELSKYIDECQPISAELENDCSETTCGAYSSFTGSPLSEGKFQFDMWGVTPSKRYNWEKLKNNVIKYGTRNSLLLAPMPTASTSQILGNNECFEPFTSNIYNRRTLAGEFVVVNNYLMRELTDLGVWNEELKNSIIANRGSIQHIDGISDHIKNKYKIVWEIPMKVLIDMAADRGAFIDQSQSLNLWMEDPNYKTLTSMHFYSWQKGLKTGIYYLRRKPRHQPQQFTIDVNSPVQDEDEPEECLMCGS